MFTIVVDRPGDSPLELTPITESCSWDSLIPGGYGSCSFQVPGLLNRRQLPYLAVVRLYFGTAQLWEGRIEDITVKVASRTTEVQAFGWRRALDFTSVRRFWSKRSIPWTSAAGMSGTVWAAVGSAGASLRSDIWAVTVGQFDQTDPTKSGVRIRGASSVASNRGDCAAAIFTLPSGLSLVRTMVFNNGYTAGVPFIQDSVDGATYNLLGSAPAGGGVTENESNTTGARYLKLGFATDINGRTVTTANGIDLYDIRLLGTSLVEDVTDGFYGGTLLRDLISLVPDLTLGTIESGTDFTIDVLDYSTRAAASAIVDQIVSFYGREWAVWEGGRFDWITPNLDEAQFVLNVADCTELDLVGSLDTLVKRSYVLYTDAASEIDAEQSADSTSQKNPFVRTGATKDDLTSPGFAMTANTSAQLAARIAAERGLYPPVTGQIVLPANQQITDHTGQKIPAFQIRAGRNVYIPDLPRDEIFTSGRDGQTLFHVVQAQADMAQETVTLQLEGQGRQLDVILNRLAAVTRTLTG